MIVCHKRQFESIHLSAIDIWKEMDEVIETMIKGTKSKYSKRGFKTEFTFKKRSWQKIEKIQGPHPVLCQFWLQSSVLKVSQDERNISFPK